MNVEILFKKFNYRVQDVHSHCMCNGGLKLSHHTCKSFILDHYWLPDYFIIKVQKNFAPSTDETQPYSLKFYTYIILYSEVTRRKSFEWFMWRRILKLTLIFTQKSSACPQLYNQLQATVQFKQSKDTFCNNAEIKTAAPYCKCFLLLLLISNAVVSKPVS